MEDDSLAIRTRRVMPAEVTRAALERINRAHPVLNAFITVARIEALRSATAEAVLGVTQPRYGHMAVLSDAVRATPAMDLA